jgi:hypothetical protein
MVKTGSSYLSQSELPVTFGLAAGGTVSAIEVMWPDRKTEKAAGAPAGTAVLIAEGKGIVRTTRIQ